MGHKHQEYSSPPILSQAIFPDSEGASVQSLKSACANPESTRSMVFQYFLCILLFHVFILFLLYLILPIVSFALALNYSCPTLVASTPPIALILQCIVIYRANCLSVAAIIINVGPHDQVGYIFSSPFARTTFSP